MNGPRKTLQERIAEELQHQEDSKRALMDLRAQLRERDRKKRNSRAIVRGLSAESYARNNPAFREQLDQATLGFVTRPYDRTLFPELFAATETAPPPHPEEPPQPAQEPSPSIAEQETASQPPHRPPKTQKEPSPGRAPA
jgi:hypothetical protein